MKHIKIVKLDTVPKDGFEQATYDKAASMISNDVAPGCVYLPFDIRHSIMVNDIPIIYKQGNDAYGFVFEDDDIDVTNEWQEIDRCIAEAVLDGVPLSVAVEWLMV